MLEPALNNLLKELTPFSNLSDMELDQIAKAATLVKLSKGERLTIGGDEETPFYLLVDGWLTLDDLKAGVEKRVGTIHVGEFFGADYVLYAIIRKTQVTAGEASQLIRLEPGDLTRFIQTQPNFKAGLLQGRRMTFHLRSKIFQWVNDNEHVKLVLRQHPMFLLESMLVPLIWLIGGLILAFLGNQMAVASLRIAFVSIGVAIISIGVLWGIWQFIDWRNDYYIITSQRVVWLEQVVGLYESRREAVLSAIKSTDIKTTFYGRMFGYGDLTVYALMGEIKFAHIPDPNATKALIDQLQKGAQIRIQQEDTRTMEKIIRRKIDPPSPVPVMPPGLAKDATPKKKPTDVLELKEFFNIETRLVRGDTITYRKHHFILLSKVFLPIVSLLAVIGGAAYCAYRNIIGLSQFPSLTTTILTGTFFSLGPLFWLWYQYVDWHNDIYQIMPDKIVDSERKPLGNEVTKSAPLGNIQNMNYERVGILGLLLNYGNVMINTGSENVMIFYKIHDPARAQMDIFNRLYEMRRKQQLSESSRQWEQVADWMAAYHRQAEDLHKSQKKE